MSSASRRTPSGQGFRAGSPVRKLRVIPLVAAGLLLLGLVLWLRPRASSDELVLYTVGRGELAIDVMARGSLQSQNQEVVYCEVEDIEGDGIRGMTIVSIVPNGSSVTEGQVLVELESASIRERLERQKLETDRARYDQIQAAVQFENQKTQNTTSLAEARLAVDLAELALQQFEDEDGGTFAIELQDVELQIQTARAEKLIEGTNLQGVEQLYKLGYRSSGELAQAQLSAMKSERQLATAMSKKRELVEYKYRKNRLELEGALASARRQLEQVARNNEALLAQAQAELDSQNEALANEQARLARYEDQISKCTIRSPKTGLVAYATQGSRYDAEIREGSAVRLRQKIISIPDLERMEVHTAVHESVLDITDPGLPVTVRVDVDSDRRYHGTVASVAVLPDEERRSSSRTNVYRTVVTIDERVDGLKPGMTSVVEIHVDRLVDVISVPVQAIVQRGRASWCYVKRAGEVLRRHVVLGKTNDRFVEVREGLEDGELVVLNPDAILDADEDRPDEDRPDEDRPDEDRPDGPPRADPPADDTAPGAPTGSEATSSSPRPELGSSYPRASSTRDESRL